MTTQVLREARTRRRWSQRHAARRLGVSQPYLSLLERGQRPVTPALARRAARTFGLPPTALRLPESLVWKVLPSHQELAEDLANLGYPGFSYLCSRKPKKNPAELLLSALAKDDLEPRVTEGLPWLLLVFSEWNTDWLVRHARLHNLQNRLGFVVSLARRVAEKPSRFEHRVTELLNLEQELDDSRLAREDTLCDAPLGQATRRWLAENRPLEAAHWNLLTDWNPEQLRYVD